MTLRMMCAARRERNNSDSKACASLCKDISPQNSFQKRTQSVEILTPIFQIPQDRPQYHRNDYKENTSSTVTNMEHTKNYNLEILAGTVHDLRHCPVACGGCPYAEQVASEGKKVQFSQRATQMFGRTQQFMDESGQQFTVSIAGTPARLDQQSFPYISGKAGAIILSAGSFTEYHGSYERLFSDIGTLLSGKISNGGRAAPLLHVYFPDRNMDLPNNESYVLEQFLAYSNAFVSSQRMLQPIGLSSSLSLALSSNDLDRESFARLKHTLTEGSILRKIHPQLCQILGIDTGEKPEETREIGEVFATETMQMYTADRTQAFAFDLRGILRNETKVFDETRVNPYNITFYANKILFGHSSRNLLTSPFWMGYEEFSALLGIASEHGRELDELVNAHFGEI